MVIWIPPLFLFYFFFNCDGSHRDLPSFPTRRSSDLDGHARAQHDPRAVGAGQVLQLLGHHVARLEIGHEQRSEEHTSELQSPDQLVCRLLLEKKKYAKEDYSSTFSRHNR